MLSAISPQAAARTMVRFTDRVPSGTRAASTSVSVWTPMPASTDAWKGKRRGLVYIKGGLGISVEP